jgi:hypothetical protein
MLALRVGRSGVSITKTTEVPSKEISALPSFFGSRLRSGARAALNEFATRRELVDTRISALHFFDVNIVCPGCNLEVTFRAKPDPRGHPAKSDRAT